MLNVNETSQVFSSFEGATRIICLTHANPDGDALGSMLGIAALLRTQYPRKEILTLCRDPAPNSFHFLPGSNAISHTVEFEQGDLIIILDTAEPKLTELHEVYPLLFSPEKAEAEGWRTLKVDHHPDGSPFAQINIIDGTAASTAEIVVDIADSLNFSMNPDVATCLLTGIYTDTGSLMHSNTSQRVYRTAARLLRAGANQKALIENIFRSSKISTLRLWGRVLEKISITEEGAAVSAVTAGDFRATGANFSELTGAIDYVNSIPGMKFSLILSERGGKVKGSLRTLRDDIDVSSLAQKFSGGGHKKAAGFSINGKLAEETRWKVIPPKTDN